RMRRPERQGTLREKLGWLRGAIPDLAIRTTCLVGFPGETDDDFRELLAFLEEAQFDRLGAFSYSPQEGTRATQYPDDVPDAVKRERLEELLEVQRAISAGRLTRFVGREVSVLVDRVADAGAGVPGGGRNALFRGPGSRGAAHRRGRSDVPRLRLLVGPADPGTRPPGGARRDPRGGGGGVELRRAVRGGGGARRTGAAADA